MEQISLREVHRWANDFARAFEAHAWVGFPCIHFFSVRAGRENLEGEGFRLFWNLLEVLKWINYKG